MMGHHGRAVVGSLAVVVGFGAAVLTSGTYGGADNHTRSLNQDRNALLTEPLPLDYWLPPEWGAARRSSDAPQGAMPTRAGLPPGPAFIVLGTLPGGAPGSTAEDVSPDGTVVVGTANSADGAQAYRWTYEDGMEALGDLPGGTFLSVATSVSENGETIGGFSSSANGPEEAFRWRKNTGMVGLGDLEGGPFQSKATAVSADGEVIVGWSSPAEDAIEAFRWSQATGMVGLGDLPDGIHASRAISVSADGSVIAGWGSSGIGVNEAFRWTLTDGMVGLGFIPNGFLEGSQGLDLTTEGRMLSGAGWAEEGVQGFRWSDESGMVPIGDLPGGGNLPYSIAFSISGDGRVMVGSSNTDLGSEAFIWDEDLGIRNLRLELEEVYGLELTGWILTEAKSVSADGLVIVGNGIRNGVDQAWLVRLPNPLSCTGDINQDAFVGPFDLSYLMDAWDSTDPYADLDGNGIVEALDLAILVDNWGPCQ